MSINYSLSGIVSRTNAKYVLINTDEGTHAFRLDRFHMSNTSLSADLAQRGITVSSKRELEALIQNVSGIGAFEPCIVAERPGWVGRAFAQHNGQLIGPETANVPLVYQPHATVGRQRGDFESWIDLVADPVGTQPVAAFLMMAAFLPCLLRFTSQPGNLTVELIGDTDTGKSTALRLAMSILSAPDHVQPCREVQRDLEALRTLGRDHPLILDSVEPVLLVTTKPKKAELYAAIAYDLPSGPGGRVTLLPSRQPLREACGIGAPDETILTLHLPPDGTGVFDTLPEGFASRADFADHLLAAAGAHHGHAYPRLIAALQHEAPVKITRLLVKAQERFRRQAAKEGLDGCSHRAMRTVAAVYAAGNLARRLGILPSGFNCKVPAFAALRLAHAAEVVSVPFETRLQELVESGRLVTLDRDANLEVQAYAVRGAIGTLTIKPSVRIIRIPQDKIRSAFPDWDAIKGYPEVRALLKVDGKNLCVKARLAPGIDRVRLFEFVLPPAVEPTLLG